VTYVIEHMFEWRPSATHPRTHTRAYARAPAHERPQGPIWAPFRAPPICGCHPHHQNAPERPTAPPTGRQSKTPSPAEAEPGAQQVNQASASPAYLRS